MRFASRAAHDLPAAMPDLRCAGDVGFRPVRATAGAIRRSSPGWSAIVVARPCRARIWASPIQCDDCLHVARPWSQGRAALLYKDNGRKLVLAMKHGDRLDLAKPAANWLLRAAQPMLFDDMVIAPVPLHWTRLFKRRYNQAALLSAALARKTGHSHSPDLILRKRNTHSQEGRDRRRPLCQCDRCVSCASPTGGADRRAARSVGG